MAPSSILFTLDLEDSEGTYLPGGRFEADAHRLLDLLEERGLRGTVFAVGRTAESSPGLLKRAAALGHELACHSWDHTPIDRQTPAQFRVASARAKHALEQAAGAEVVGFRAPQFSLIAKTAWAADELKGLGYLYSSSVLPAYNPLYGFARASRNPFRWPCGLVEFPVPVAGLGPFAVPYLGGIYLRYFPLSVILLLARLQGGNRAQWTYVHPYDCDETAALKRNPGQPLWRHWLQRFNRGGTIQKLAAVLAGEPAPTMGELAANKIFVESLGVGPYR